MKFKLSVTGTLLLLITFFVMSQQTKAQEPPVSTDLKQELRGAWLTPITGELSSYSSEAQFKQEMNEALDVLEYYNMNALFFHVRTHNNALYDSMLSPKASWFSSVNFQTFDPLEWMIAETKSRGIEFHAWMNPYRIDSGYYGSSLPATNPASSPSNLLSYGGKTIFNPGLPNVRDFIVDSVLELVENYDVDAVHFDDYFYIDLGAEGKTSGTTTILDEADQSTFELYSGGYNIASAMDKAEWRRDQVNMLMSGLKTALSNHNSVNNKHVQFGVSPTGIYKNGNGVVTYDINGKPITNGSSTAGQSHYTSYLFSDSVKWITEGWVDYLIPQSYWATNHNVAAYPNVMGWWNKVNKNLNINIYSGIGVYMSASEYNTYAWQSDPDEFVNQLSLLNTYENITGSSVYSFQYLKRAYLGTASMATTQINNVKNNQWSNKAILPEIKSMTSEVISGSLNHYTTASYVSWNRLEGVKNYYVFASDSPLQYTSNEIIGVVGQQATSTIKYNLSTNPNHYYGILPISKTNTLGSPSKMEIQMNLGASIRTQGVQGLKYQATFDTNLLSMERGFFIVYGQASVSDLLSVITNNPMTLNGKQVFKNNNYDQTTKTISVVLTGIPESGYAQKISVFAYAYDGIDYILAPSAVTKSISEVAIKAAKAGNATAVAGVLATLEADYYTHYLDEFGNYQISSIYEADRVKLRTQFINDWNTLFGTAWTSLDGATFHAYAKVGSTTSDLSGSRIYQFFNDTHMSQKWGWVLEYMKTQDTISWPTWQSLAIQADGTFDNKPNLYDSIHLNYSIANFFNNAYQKTGYEAIDFTNNSRYASVSTHNKSIYIEGDVSSLLYKGSSITLPQYEKPGFAFLGWYNNSSFSGSVVTSTVVNTLSDKTFYPKLTSLHNSITYNLNGGGFYLYPTREAMVDDFILDFNAHSGKSVTKTSFFDGTWHATNNYAADFLNSQAYSTKWGWLKTYIINTGSSVSYISQSGLTSDTANIWRSNIWAFINEDYRTASPASINFTNSTNANGFWTLITKAPEPVYPDNQAYTLEIPFRLGYTFSGWYENPSFTGSPISIIGASETGTKIYYAKWQ